jgi:hypothetical protein
MRDSKSRLGVLVAALFLAGSVIACSSATPRQNTSTGGSGGDGDTGGSTGSTGGKSGTGGKTGTGGSSATGGDGGGAGGATGGSGGGDTGGAGGSTGGAGGSDTGGAGGGDTGGAGGGGNTGGSGGGTGGGGGGGAGGSTGALLSCWADPKVIHICHQLENACENCGPKKAVACKNGMPKEVCGCFDLVDKAFMGMATDADCEKYAAANNCTVDNATTTGNICGSLNCDLPACKCTTPGCDGEAFKGKTCAADQHWGDATGCQKWAAKCPCK